MCLFDFFMYINYTQQNIRVHVKYKLKPSFSRSNCLVTMLGSTQLLQPSFSLSNYFVGSSLMPGSALLLQPSLSLSDVLAINCLPLQALSCSNLVYLVSVASDAC